MIRVGFVFAFDDSWLGGVNYFRNLFTALYALPERQIEAVVFTGHEAPEKHFDGFPALRIVRSRMFDKGTLALRLRHIVRYRLGRDFLFERMLKRHGVSVLSHSDWLPGNAPVPAIGWIPDFQHVHLPDFFSADEVAARDRHFGDMCRYCAAIIVSSHDAQADLARFDQGCAARSRVLQFVVAPIDRDRPLPGREELQARYKFPGKYFLLPNQFWKHKNHRMVIEALGLLAREGKRVRVLATGSTTDYRHPDYFSSLMERAGELDVLDSFRHLGVVSSAELAGLMRDALAIINPSLFEGWSTTVEEAKALGKRVLLSDIPVHREQDPARGRYFPPHDAHALAGLLWETWNAPDADESEVGENARRATDERRTGFARGYQQIVLDIAGRAR